MGTHYNHRDAHKPVQCCDENKIVPTRQHQQEQASYHITGSITPEGNKSRYDKENQNFRNKGKGGERTKGKISHMAPRVPKEI